jgi:hypothetical protein
MNDSAVDDRDRKQHCDKSDGDDLQLLVLKATRACECAGFVSPYI